MLIGDKAVTSVEVGLQTCIILITVGGSNIILFLKI